MLGIIGNILSAVVLSRPQMRSSVTCLLLGLAFCDSLLIVFSTLIFGLPAMSDFTGALKTYRHVFYPLWVPYFYPISTTGKFAGNGQNLKFQAARRTTLLIQRFYEIAPV